MSTTESTHLSRIQLGGYQWWIRPETSDLTAIREVVEKRSYFSRNFQIEAGERWLDAGANIGAFSVVAAAAGAQVTAYEPWSANAALARQNLRENGLQARVREQAITLQGGRARLGLARSEWRHSLLRPGGAGQLVPCTAFQQAIADCDCAKLDIEGAEIAILQQADLSTLHKLTFEWHFDYERATDTYLAVLERLSRWFPQISARKVPAGIDYNWFPAAAIVRCQR